MTRLRRLPALLLVAAGVACAGPVGAQALGPDPARHAPGPFDALLIDGAGQVLLSQGERDEVLVASDNGLARSVEVHLSGHRLTLIVPGSWKFWRSGRPQIEVRMRELRQVTLSGRTDLYAPAPIRAGQVSVSISGSGNVRMDALTAEQLSFDVSGAGEGQFAGEVERLGTRISGNGKLRAPRLRSSQADISISGVGNADLWVTGDLKVRISGAGAVSYLGEPALHQSISGVGSVRRYVGPLPPPPPPPSPPPAPPPPAPPPP